MCLRYTHTHTNTRAHTHPHTFVQTSAYNQTRSHRSEAYTNIYHVWMMHTHTHTHTSLRILCTYLRCALDCVCLHVLINNSNNCVPMQCFVYWNLNWKDLNFVIWMQFAQLNIFENNELWDEIIFGWLSKTHIKLQCNQNGTNQLFSFVSKTLSFHWFSGFSFSASFYQFWHL